MLALRRAKEAKEKQLEALEKSASGYSEPGRRASVPPLPEEYRKALSAYKEKGQYDEEAMMRILRLKLQARGQLPTD